jgi:hypothetical protein
MVAPKFWLDGYLKEWLEHGKKAVSKNWDYVVLVDGVEGSGKSGLAISCAYYQDPTFNVDRIVFTPEQFITAVDNSKPEQAIVWDEFVLGGLSDDALKEIQTTIIKKLVTIRKKRLYIFLLIPYLFMLRPYFAVGRSRLMLHTYSTDGLNRGMFKLYNYERKKDLYFKGKKYYSYIVPPTKKGKFGDAAKWDIIDWDAYEQKKDVATETINTKAAMNKNKFREGLKALIGEVKEPMNYTYKRIAKICGFSERTINNLISEYNEEKSMQDALSNINNGGKNVS